MHKKDYKHTTISTREDWTLLRTFQGITQRTGIRKEDLDKLVAKELTDNALDAGASCDIGLIENGFYVKDNGNGIPCDDKEIANLFSIKRPLKSTKLYRLPNRGALGNGLRIVAGTVLAAKGSLLVKTRGRILKLYPQFETGETSYESGGKYDSQGTVIEVTLPELMSKDILEWSEKAIYLSGKGNCYESKSSVYWYDFDSFFELVKSAPEDLTVIKFIKQFEGCSGRNTSIISKKLSLNHTHINKTKEEDAEILLKEIRNVSKPVNPKRLGYIGEIEDYEGYSRKYFEIEIPVSKDKFTTTIPYVIESWATKSDNFKVTFFVNRTPIIQKINHLYDEERGYLSIFGCGIYSKIKIKKSSLKILVSIITPFMPITSDGKEPDFSFIKGHITDSINKTLKKIKAEAVNKNKSGKFQNRVIIKNIDESIKKVRGEEGYRYSLRQLYYVMRPIVLSELGEDLQYNNFNQIITDYELKIGHDLPGVYRDSRGTLYHPHISQEIPLGTLNIETYNRPLWTFNKILYCEKEGFFEILKSNKWPEKNDCALLSSKGFSSRAARDMIDMLGETDEEIFFFCIHDADASGTLIYQSLVNETKARKKRKVYVLNLGLEPEEGLKMGLPEEKIIAKKREKRPSADYVEPEWKEWLNNYRIELNTMDSPTLIKWLNEKFQGYKKLIPSYEILSEELINLGQDNLRQIIKNKVLLEAKIEEKVEELFKQKSPYLKDKFIENFSLQLLDFVESELKDNPKMLWKDIIKNLANKFVNEMEL